VKKTVQETAAPVVRQTPPGRAKKAEAGLPVMPPGQAKKADDATAKVPPGRLKKEQAPPPALTPVLPADHGNGKGPKK
jgi:hypothetical protein